MWGSLLAVLSSDVPSGFPYALERASFVASASGWCKVGRARHKADGAEATVYMFERGREAAAQAEQLRRVAKNCKSVRHPGILSVYEVLETNAALYVITEPAKQLSAALAENGALAALTKDTLAWGLHSIAEAIAFLHDQAHLVHGTVSLDTIYIAWGGQWKLGILETALDADHSTAHTLKAFMEIHPLNCLYTRGAPKYQLGALQSQANPSGRAVDRAFLASLMTTLFSFARSGSPPAKWDFRINRGATPADAVDFVNSLVNTAADAYDWQSHLADCPYFANDDLTKTVGFFDAIAIKGNWDRERFLDSTLQTCIAAQSMISQTRVLLPRVARLLNDNTVLNATTRPMALTAFLRLLGNCETCTKKEFDDIIWESVVKLYSDPERSTRYLMLQTLPKYEPLLSTQQVETVVQTISPGLSDSSAELRDITLRSISGLMARLLAAAGSDEEKSGGLGQLTAAVTSQIQALTTGTLTDRVIRSVCTMLQTDSSDQIRTNSVICLNHLLGSFSTSVITSKVGPALLAGANDNFPPCRHAALESLINIVDTLSMSELAMKYIPALSPKLVDSDEACKRSAIRLLKACVNRWIAASPSASDECLTHMGAQATPSIPTGLCGASPIKVAVKSEPSSASAATMAPTAATVSDLPTTSAGSRINASVVAPAAPQTESRSGPRVEPSGEPGAKSRAEHQDSSRPNVTLEPATIGAPKAVIPGSQAPALTASRSPAASPSPNAADEFWKQLDGAAEQNMAEDLSAQGTKIVKRSLRAKRR